MKKLLLLLAIFVLSVCTVLPAFAETEKEVTTLSELEEAIADETIDRVIIAADITVSADSSKPLPSPFDLGFYALKIDRDMTLEIGEGHTLTTAGTNTCFCGILGTKDLTITGKGKLSAVNLDGVGTTEVIGVATTQRVVLTGGINIRVGGATGSGCNAAIFAGDAEAVIMDANIECESIPNPTELGEGTHVLGGKFSFNPTAFLGNNCEAEAITEDPYTYKVINNASVKFSPETVSLDVTDSDKSSDVTIKLEGDTDITSFDTLLITPTEKVEGFSYNISPTDGKITFTATQAVPTGTYTFTVDCEGKVGSAYLGKTTTYTVQVVNNTSTFVPLPVIITDPDPETETETETKKSGSGGGCNAGFGSALAVAGLVVAAARRKK